MKLDVTSPRTRTSFDDLFCLAILASIWIAMAALANPIGDFPLNDDWVYGLAVKSILELGEFRLPSPASANLFAQAYWGALFCLPFGFSFTALRMSTLVLGLIGIFATFGILRQLGVGSRHATLAAALVAVNPLYFALANTFMTDVPFFAVCAVSLFFLVKWAFDRSGRNAMLGLLFAMLAILIRQVGIVIPLVFAVAYVVVNGFRARTVAFALLPLVIGVLLHYGFQAWLLETGRMPVLVEPPLLSTVIGNLSFPRLAPIRLFTFVAYVGLFALPILVVESFRAWERADPAGRRFLGRVFLAATAVSVACVIAIGTPMPFIDNVLNNFGIGPLTLTDTYLTGRNYPVVPLWLKAFWYGAALAAIVGAALLACLGAYRMRGVDDHPRSGHMLTEIIVVGSGVAYMVIGALAFLFFYDRYILYPLLATLLFVGSLLGRDSSGPPSKQCVAIFVLVLALEAALTVVATRDYLEWNRMRWTATRDLLAGGVPRTSIDGGYEFNGWLGYRPGYQRKPGKSPYWVDDDEYIIASGPLPGYSVVRAYPYSRLLTGGDPRVVVLRREPPRGSGLD